MRHFGSIPTDQCRSRSGPAVPRASVVEVVKPPPSPVAKGCSPSLAVEAVEAQPRVNCKAVAVDPAPRMGRLPVAMATMPTGFRAMVASEAQTATVGLRAQAGMEPQARTGPTAAQVGMEAPMVEARPAWIRLGVDPATAVGVAVAVQAKPSTHFPAAALVAHMPTPMH